MCVNLWERERFCMSRSQVRRTSPAWKAFQKRWRCREHLPRPGMRRMGVGEMLEEVSPWHNFLHFLDTAEQPCTGDGDDSSVLSCKGNVALGRGCFGTSDSLALPWVPAQVHVPYPGAGCQGALEG